MEDYVSEAYAKVTYAGEKIRFQSLHIAHIYLVMSEHLLLLNLKLLFQPFGITQTIIVAPRQQTPK